MKFFMEPTAISLNYLKSFARRDHFPEYRAFHMVGFSGGGWTTTLYAAIDPSIRCSFSVAGSIPLYLRSRLGDREQSEVSFYERAGYPDLYVLGSFGMGREQVQILNRRDDCCFGETQHDSQELYSGYQESLQDYEKRVRAALQETGSGSFRLEIDETAPFHMISRHAVEDVIVPELRKSCSALRMASRQESQKPFRDAARRRMRQRARRTEALGTLRSSARSSVSGRLAERRLISSRLRYSASTRSPSRVRTAPFLRHEEVWTSGLAKLEFIVSTSSQALR
jgi:pimeloyl-ACP methyl ester carboxylesterase